MFRLLFCRVYERIYERSQAMNKFKDMRDFYESIMGKTAETTKLVANARLAIVISFSNEIFLMNKELRNKGIDEKFIIDSLTLDSRIDKYASMEKRGEGHVS